MLALAPTLVGERNLNLKRIFLKRKLDFFGRLFRGGVGGDFFYMLLIMSMVWGMSEVGKNKIERAKVIIIITTTLSLLITSSSS